MSADAPSTEQRIFNGKEPVMVPYCCQGHVKLVEIREARAWANMVEGPTIRSSYLACINCNKVLPETPIKSRVLKAKSE